MKDSFKNLETEKISLKNKNNSDNINQIVDSFIDDDLNIKEILTKNSKKISKAIKLFIDTFASGSNIYFLGAGTSGRLGIIEAAECPPTFGTSPNRIVGIIAGGKNAVFKSKEGVEDSLTESTTDLVKRNFSKNDLLIGLSASGKSNYVLSGVEFARKLKANTILITCNKVPKNTSNLDIFLNVGPEFVGGSTRLTSGTMTKVALNMIPTISMIKLEKVYQNMMIDISPTTNKLRSRSIRNLSNILNIDDLKSIKLLEKSNWDIRAAVFISKMNINASEAKKLAKKISLVELLNE